MLTRHFLLAATAAALVALNFMGCKDDDYVPTVPKSLNIKDGEIVRDTIITLSAGGSFVKEGEIAAYHYYVGTSIDNLQDVASSLYEQKITIKPYTQYYLCVRAESTINQELSDASEIRTFYCVPPLEIETDNGVGDFAAVLRFKNVKNINSGKVLLTPNKEGYNYQKEIEIAADSCLIKMGDVNNPTNTAFTHQYDDEQGVTYEPIIYTFSVSIDIQVGDKSFTITGTQKEILIDKNKYVHDLEYNVYRLVRIGDKVWTADNYIITSFIKDNLIQKFDNYNSSTEEKIYNTIILPTGEKTISYYLFNHLNETGEELFNILKRDIPKGFHIATVDDWLDLEKYYGVSINTTTKLDAGRATIYGYIHIPSYKNYLYESVYEGESTTIRNKLLSQYGWYDTLGVEIPHQKGLLNVKPFGVDEITVGKGAIFIADANPDDAVYVDLYTSAADNCWFNGQYIGICNYLEGLIRTATYISKHPVCIRLVKDE